MLIFKLFYVFANCQFFSKLVICLSNSHVRYISDILFDPKFGSLRWILGELSPGRCQTYQMPTYNLHAPNQGVFF